MYNPNWHSDRGFIKKGRAWIRPDEIHVREYRALTEERTSEAVWTLLNTSIPNAQAVENEIHLLLDDTITTTASHDRISKVIKSVFQADPSILITQSADRHIIRVSISRENGQHSEAERSFNDYSHAVAAIPRVLLAAALKSQLDYYGEISLLKKQIVKEAKYIGEGCYSLPSPEKYTSRELVDLFECLEKNVGAIQSIDFPPTLILPTVLRNRFVLTARHVSHELLIHFVKKV